MAVAKKGVKRRKAKRNKTDLGPSNGPNPNVALLLEEVRAIKRLLVLQLVALGVKPIDIGVALNLVKSAISDLMPIRRLSIRKRVERGTIHDLAANELTTRLDTLIGLLRK